MANSVPDMWYNTTLGLLLLLLSGCVAGPDYVPPDLATPAGYQQSEVTNEHADLDWWQGFTDPVLNRLVDTAMSGNLDLGAAQASLAALEAAVRAERSDFWPSVDAFGTAQHETDFTGNRSDSQQLGLTLAFMPDLFGLQRRRLEQAMALHDRQRHNIDDLRRLIASAVATAYVELRRAQARLILLDTSLKLQSQTLEIVRLRNSAGLSPKLDVERAAADLAQTRAQQGNLQRARVEAQNTLAVLSGTYALPPQDLQAEAPDVPAFALGPQIGTPADLLHQRPDLQAAEANLLAATAAIGVETAELYPSLRLPMQLSADAGQGVHLVDHVLGEITAAVDLPLLDAGRRRAEINAAEARAQAALLAYRQALLISVNEVESALAAIRYTSDQRAELARAVTASEGAYAQLDALYREGLTTFIDILDAQRTLISSREAYVETEADLASAYIALYTALGI